MEGDSVGDALNAPSVVLPGRTLPGSPGPGAVASPSPSPCPAGPPPATGIGIPPGNTVPGSGGRPDSMMGVTPGMIGTTGPVASTPPRVIVCACSSFCKNKASASATPIDPPALVPPPEEVRGIVDGDQVGWDCCNSQEIAVGRGVLARDGRLVAPLRGCWDAVSGLGLVIS